ncbi:MAG: dTDP-4-dehydrorhamnose reductase [Candidatus Omnitrophica bacterium]|nr:dTDP-4-dehydrorhamnose reductase [Candidatus Omnitrophota bacterium]
MKNNKFLISGASGQLSKEFQKIFHERKIDFAAPSEEEWDITDFTKTRTIINEAKPNVIINCAAYNLVDEAEENSKLAHLVNSQAVENLARICKENKIFLVHYSSDYVFDGQKQDLYVEEDMTNPLNVYGKSKLEGEQAIKECLSDFLIFRLSWVIGKGKQNFLYKLRQWAEKSKVLKITSDEVSVPTYTENIVNVTLLSLEKGITGLFHLTNTGYASRHELARYFINRMGTENIIVPVSIDTFKTKAKRPMFSAMSNLKIKKTLDIAIPKWEESTDKFIRINDYTD